MTYVCMQSPRLEPKSIFHITLSGTFPSFKNPEICVAKVLSRDFPGALVAAYDNIESYA